MSTFAPESKTILIVDDDESIREGFSKILEDANYKTATANSVREGYKVIDDISPDLVLLDLKLPDAVDLEVVKHAKEKDLDTYFIIITGNPSLESTLEAIQEHIFSYLMKPADPQNLLKLVEKALSQQQEERTVTHDQETLKSAAINRELKMAELKEQLKELEDKQSNV